MRRACQVGSFAFFVLSLFVVVEATKLTYYTDVGPGPGFFPFWLGIILAVLSIWWFMQVRRRPVDWAKEGFIPDRAGATRSISILVALALFAGLADVIGFQILTFVLLLFLLVALGRRDPILTTAVSLAGSFGLYFLFSTWLGVELPTSSIDLLRNLGL